MATQGVAPKEFVRILRQAHDFYTMLCARIGTVVMVVAESTHFDRLTNLVRAIEVETGQ